MAAYVYMLRCRDGSLYTGWTNNVRHRLAMHQQGKGAKYTRGRGPVVLVYTEELPDKIAALKREAALKKLSHRAKETLCRDYLQQDGDLNLNLPAK